MRPSASRAENSPCSCSTCRSTSARITGSSWNRAPSLSSIAAARSRKTRNYASRTDIPAARYTNWSPNGWSRFKWLLIGARKPANDDRILKVRDCHIMVGMISRRGFLETSSAAALLANTASAKQLKTVGVQLYTVRSVLPKKPAETLKAIEAIGYREVEATYDNLDKIWPSLQATSLKPVSIHLNENTIMKGTDDEIARAVDKVKQHGFSYAVFPWINPPDRGGLDKMKALAEKLNKAGEKCRAAGLPFCYHNHAFEFEPMDGTTRFQVLLDTLDKNLVGFEIDCFWISVAGHDQIGRAS